MADVETRTVYSRRRFLKSGGALLAGGVIGCASTNALSQSKQSAEAPPPLPWNWGRIDPTEAGSRAFRFYHDLGG
ncbi:MAG: twin-arginine translocation signal domain-containing protein [Desulforhabdus sp.]|nr:twin-arginine translocation signal domain-containing protein [Desulforhabdus sp.]